MELFSEPININGHVIINKSIIQHTTNYMASFSGQANKILIVFVPVICFYAASGVDVP